MGKQITPNPAAGNLDFLTNDMDTKQELQDQPVGEISSDVAVVDAENTDIVVVSPARGSIINVVDLSTEEFPDLDTAEVAPIDLMSEYWTPKSAGEQKRVVFDRFGDMEVLDQKTNQPQNLPCAFFYEKQDGHIRCVSNGSKRLVGALQNMHIAQGTLLLIEYLGKKKNSTNSNMSDDWSVKPLVPKKA